MKSKISIIVLVVLTLASLMQPFFADAALVNCGLRDANDQVDQCTFNDMVELVYIIVNYLIGMAGFVAIFFVVWGGVQMMLAFGDGGKITDAKKTITNALLGLVMVMLAYLVVGWVAGIILPDTDNPVSGLIDFIDFGGN